MDVNKTKFKKIVLAFLLLLAILMAGFTVFCQMPSNNHSYNFLFGKDQCGEDQSPRGCGSAQISQDILGYKLLSDSPEVKMFLGLLIIVLLGFVSVFSAATPPIQARIKYRFRYRFLARLHNYLIHALSQGILHPKLYNV